MKTSEQVHVEFSEKLRMLLNEYDAEISLVDVGRGYCRDQQMEIFIPAVYADGEIISEDATIMMGSYASGAGI